MKKYYEYWRAGSLCVDRSFAWRQRKSDCVRVCLGTEKTFSPAAGLLFGLFRHPLIPHY